MDSAEAQQWRDELESIEAAHPDGSLPSPLAQYLRVNTSVVMPLAARLAADRRILDVVELSRGQEVQVDVDEADKAYLALQPGQMSLHHGLAIHGSGPNTSDDRRLGFAIRFIAPDVVQNDADRDYAMLVRGVDLHRNFLLYAPPADNFTPASLELYARIRDDQAAALAKGAAQEVKMYSSS